MEDTSVKNSISQTQCKELSKLILICKKGKWQERLRAVRQLKQFSHCEGVSDLIIDMAQHDEAPNTRYEAVKIANTLGYTKPNGKPFRLTKFHSLNKLLGKHFNKKIDKALIQYFTEKGTGITKKVELKEFIPIFEKLYPKEFDIISGRMTASGAFQDFFKGEFAKCLIWENRLTRIQIPKLDNTNQKEKVTIENAK